MVAEKVFGWKEVRRRDGELVGKKQDRAGRWRTAKVPRYADDPTRAYEIDERMKQLGRWSRYEQELARIASAQKLPQEWATPEQKGRAAIKAVAR
jgi:hypothetical protein